MTDDETYNINGRIKGVKLPPNFGEMNHKYMQDCPKCRKKKFIVSIFGNICYNCSYEGMK